MKRLLVPLLFVLALALAGCQAEVGERCDGFFTNTCKSPASCVETDDGAYCANSCGTGHKCPEGYECRMVTVDGLPMGGHCLPVKK
jgi:hypothetical protein